MNWSVRQRSSRERSTPGRERSRRLAEPRPTSDRPAYAWAGRHGPELLTLGELSLDVYGLAQIPSDALRSPAVCSLQQSNREPGSALIDHGHPRAARVTWTRRLKGLARQAHRSSIGAMCTAEHFHERALACSVLADQALALVQPRPTAIHHRVLAWHQSSCRFRASPAREMAANDRPSSLSELLGLEQSIVGCGLFVVRSRYVFAC